MKKQQDIADMLSTVKTELPPSSVPNQPDDADVATRAYEIYEAKGRINGSDVDDWLQAERELQH